MKAQRSPVACIPSGRGGDVAIELDKAAIQRALFEE
jgi:hypothetical protein